MNLHFNIQPGFAGTQTTVAAMSELVAQAKVNQTFREFCTNLLRKYDISGTDSAAIVKVFYRWIKNNIRYVHDPHNQEYVQIPNLLLRSRAGDCDDMAALFAAMCQSVGIETRFVVIGNDPDSMEHIYCEVRIGSDWLPVDVTGDIPLGQSVSMDYKTTLKGIAMNENSMSVSDLFDAVHDKSCEIIETGLKTGQLESRDLSRYVRLIDEGTSPYAGTVVDGAIRDALLQYMPVSTESGAGIPFALSGGGFFGTLINGVKATVKEILGSASGTIELPDIVVGSGGVSTVPSVSQAGIMQLLQRYWPLLAIAVGALYLSTRKR